MKDETDKDKLLRVLILDSLVSYSGRPLTPYVIGDLTSEILGRVLDVIRDGE